MDYLESYLSDLEHVPPHLQQESKIMRDLDQKVQDIVREAQERMTKLMKEGDNWTKEERSQEEAKIRGLYKKGKEICNDKVSRAENAYELVDKQIRRLDSDMSEFKKALGSYNHSIHPSLAEKDVKKTQKSRSKNGKPVPSSPKVPATVALAMALSTNPGEVLDMPVDPNEPTYCLCQQVSFGDMVACDNRNCPIEWFHFECVGLTDKPKGRWFCPQCKVGSAKDDVQF